MKHEINPDQHGPLGTAMADAVSTCVHCGFCLAACPTYEVLGQEADSPRGRIVLMKEVLEGNLPVEVAATHTDACLGCLACEPACPSGVPYRDLISPFRAITEPQRKRSLGSRLRRFMAQSALPYPGRFRLAIASGKLAKPLARWLPAAIRPMLELVPDKVPAKVVLQNRYPAVGKQRGRVALLAGCAQTVLDPDINLATIDVLTRNGIEVLVPDGQGCCGALSWHVGSHADAKRFAEKNLSVFPEDVDAILTNAAGCGSGMHEYGLILKGTAAEDRAEKFSKRVQDVSVYLDQIGLSQPIPAQPRKLRIAYHDACHLANAQNVRSQPRSLLSQIPGATIVEITDGHLCCGSAGTYNIDQPETAGELGRAKAGNILATDADVVATGNIGCTTQIQTHLGRQQSSLPVKHTLQILRDAYQSPTGA